MRTAGDARRRSADLPNADNSTPLMAAAGLGTRSPGEDAGTESEVLEAVQVRARSRRRHQRRRQQRRDRDARRRLQEPARRSCSSSPRKGAKIDVWNRKNKHGWTPLAIADGYRFGNFKPSPETEAAIREVMIAAGVTPPKTVVAKTQQIY